MPSNKTPVKVQQPSAADAKAFFRRAFDYVATIYFAITVVILPLFMGKEKYTAITAAKSNFFSVLSMLMLIASIVLLAAMCIYTVDGPDANGGKKQTLLQRLKKDPLLAADIAIVAYWVLMLISCLLSYDVRTALYGLDPRNNGFFYQTLYVAAYFVISRTMKPTRTKALLFVWGSVALGIVTILHYFGVDVYDVVHYSTLSKSGEWIKKTLSSEYAGPFWDSSSYRFLGPVGNVNLGSYVLSVALVLAAGFYITGVQPVFWYLKKVQIKQSKDSAPETKILPESLTDKYGISLLVSFVVILYAELNINTDAGLVAIAAAVVAIPIVLCCTLERLIRGLTVFTAAAGTAALSSIIDRTLCGKSLGTTGKALLALTVVLGLLTIAAVFAKNKEKLRSAFTPKRMRAVMSGIMVLAMIGGICLSLYITKPDDPAAGSISGAAAILQQEDLKEKSDSIVHELGQILRGNLDDSFGHNRLFTWKRTLSLIKYNPLLGIGPDNFKTFFASHYREEAVEMFPASNGNIDKAHNEFLDVLLSNGVLGFTAYMLFFAALLFCCFRRPDAAKYAPVFGVAVISYMAHAFFGYQLPIQSPVMWMLIGAAGAFAQSEAGYAIEESK